MSAKPTFQLLAPTEWIAMHRSPKYISASQIPAILGVSRHTSAFALHQRLTGHLPPDNYDSFDTRLGHHMEPFLAHEYMLLTGRPVEDPGDTAILTHPDLPYLYCTIDRIAFDGAAWGDLEMKTLKAYLREAKEWRSGDPPLAAQAQVQTQLLISGLTWAALVGCIHGEGKVTIVDIKPHAKMQEIILAAVQEFKWRLERDIAPAIDGSKSTRNAVEELAGSVRGEILDAPEDLEETMRITLEERREAVRNRDAWADKVNACESKFVDWIGNAEGIRVNGSVIKRPQYVRAAKLSIPLKGYDSNDVQAIEKDLSDLDIGYKVSGASTYRRFYWPGDE